MAKKSTRLEALHQAFEENGISSDTIELSGSLIKNIKSYADAVPDYRHPSYTKHLLGDIIMIVFLRFLEMQMNGEKSKALQKGRKHGFENTWSFRMAFRRMILTAL